MFDDEEDYTYTAPPVPSLADARRDIACLVTYVGYLRSKVPARRGRGRMPLAGRPHGRRGRHRPAARPSSGSGGAARSLTRTPSPNTPSLYPTGRAFLCPRDINRQPIDLFCARC